MVKKSKKKGSKFIWFVIGFIVIIGTIVSVAVSPIFNIRDIRIVGNRHYSDNQLSEIVNIGKQDNWFLKVAKNTKISPKNMMLYRYFDAEENIKQICPYVKDAKVVLSGFGEYTIEVLEREPIACVSYLASYVLIDNEGVALEIVENIGERNIPKLNGVSLTSVNLGQKLCDSQNEIGAFCKIYNIVKEADRESTQNLYENIDYIDLSNLKDVSMFLDGRILVYLGDIRDINQYKINYTKEIFWNNLTKDEEGVLRFRDKKNPTFTKKIYA